MRRRSLPVVLLALLPVAVVWGQGRAPHAPGEVVEVEVRWTERHHVADAFFDRRWHFVYLDRTLAVVGVGPDAQVTRLERHFLRASQGGVAQVVSGLQGRRVVLARDAGWTATWPDGTALTTSLAALVSRSLVTQDPALWHVDAQGPGAERRGEFAQRRPGELPPGCPGVVAQLLASFDASVGKGAPSCGRWAVFPGPDVSRASGCALPLPIDGWMVEVDLELTQELRRPSVPFPLPSVTEPSGR